MIRPGSRERSFRAAMLLAGDFAVAWACLTAAVYLRRLVPLPFTRALLAPERSQLDATIVILFGSAFLTSLGLAGFYRRRIMSRARPILTVALVIQVAIIALVTTFLERPMPRTIVLLVPLFELLLFPLWRALQRAMWPVRPRDTILVGDAEEVTSALALVAQSGDDRIRISGHGHLDDEAFRARIRDAEEVICVASESSHSRLELLRIRGARGYLLLASSADALLISSVLGWIGDEPLVEVMIGCGFGVRAIVKRGIDVAIATLLLVLSSPLSLAIALAIWLDDRGPILLRQARLGLHGVPFAMWKFRSMRDERVTRVGNLLRRYRLDEVPQLLNVLMGDMSLVGPRPERPEIAERILADVPDFDLRCLVRPGIAGLAQILAEYDARPAVKLRYDLTYMCSWSLWLDVRLLFLSVAAALSGSGI